LSAKKLSWKAYLEDMGNDPSRDKTSPAYKQGGLILITFDEGSTDTACCGESSGASSSHPNTPLHGLGGPGGGPVGRSRTSSACRT
jgi:hypothetical protein